MLTPLIGDILLTHGTHVSMIYIMLRRLGLTPSLVGWSVLILTLMTKICRKNMLELYLLCQIAAVWKRINNHEKKAPRTPGILCSMQIAIPPCHGSRKDLVVKRNV